MIEAGDRRFWERSGQTGSADELRAFAGRCLAEALDLALAADWRGPIAVRIRWARVPSGNAP